MIHLTAERGRALGNALRRFRTDPVGFCRFLLDMDPHAGQQKWLNNSTRSENALVTGNRWGKSYCAAAKQIWRCTMLVGWNDVLWAAMRKKHGHYHGINVSITADQSRIVWNTAYELVQNPKISWMVRDVKMTPFPRIEFINGAVLEARSTTRNGKHLLGHVYDSINWDEAAYESKFVEVRDNVLRMRLVDRAGQLDYTTTGNGRNDFGLYFLRALDGKEPVYAQSGSTRENPHIDRARLEYEAARMSPQRVAQNIDGAIIDMGGTFFLVEDLQACHDSALTDVMHVLAQIDDVEAWIKLYPDWDRTKRAEPENNTDWVRKYPTHLYAHGWDLADKADWTVGFTLDITTRPYTLVEFERFNKRGWEHVRARIRDRSRRYRGITVVDSTGVGDAILDDLRDVGAQGVNFSGGRKGELLGNWQRMISMREVRWPFVRPVYDEHKFYQLDDKGLDTDCVMAGALAGWIVKHGEVPPAPAGVWT
jgi:hypothetical protein